MQRPGHEGLSTGRLAVITRSRHQSVGLLAGVAMLAATSATAVSSAATAAQLERLPGASGARETVILLLARPCPQAARLAEGTACPAQAPVIAALKAAGAQIRSATTLVDTVTATVSAAEAAALRRSPFVSRVVPDSRIYLGARGPQALQQPLQQPQQQPAELAQAAHPFHSSAQVRPMRAHGVAPAGQRCGTRSDPEVDPEALRDINANEARAAGIDGSGVTVAVLADGLSPTNPDFLRNAAFGPDGTPVITQYLDFTGTGTGVKSGGEEAFGDASSIAAQGNIAYNLARYVNPAVAALMPKSGCWVKILGASPGASLLALQVIGPNDFATDSGIVQAIQYAVQHGAKVINESFGADDFPDTSLDIVRSADDAAVAAGVTVVVSSGDAGPTSTIGSPASDPNVISVGATTNFRSYAQTDLGGFYNPAVGNGHWTSNNIASLSSGGYNQSGGTVDLVAPGDSNWALCSTDYKLFTDCKDILGGADNGIDTFGGTSEASPLTAAAAADVIQAYALTHAGAYPSPALVKQVLCSTASDIGAPAGEQGAGLLNVAGAVRLAESLAQPGAASSTTSPGVSSSTTTSPTGAGTTAVPQSSTTTTSTTTTSTTTPSTTTTTSVTMTSHPIVSPPPSTATIAPPAGSVLVGPNQVNVVGQPGQTTKQVLSITNTGAAPTSVSLSTRALTHRVYDSGTRQFTIDPAKPTMNTGAFAIWSGVTEVYQVETFRVPVSHSARLVFSADYPHTDQNSLLHFALFEPDGTYAAYSDPQGVGDYGEVEVASPPAGKWTALFFTEQNGATKGGIGTSGMVQWDASTWDYAPGSAVSPSVLDIGPGQTATATLSVVLPRAAGDTGEAVVVKAAGGRTTVPVTERTMIAIGANGGAFDGVLSGGNGRQSSPAQTNTYFFQVPKGKADLDATIALSSDPGEALVGYLLDPHEQTVGYSSNYTLVPSGSSFEPSAPSYLVPGTTPYLQMYNAAPEAGMWELVLAWQNPVTGNELREPFAGSILFDRVLSATAGLPNSASRTLPRGKALTVDVYVANTGTAPEAYFVDPRLAQYTYITLNNMSPGTSATKLSLPRPATLNFPPGIPLYLVPTGTKQLDAKVTRLTGSSAVTFDMSPMSGDPDISPTVATPGIDSSGPPTAPSLSLSEPEVTSGLWDVVPDEVGPFPATGAAREFVDTKVTVLTRAFDTAVHDSGDDLWRIGLSFSKFFYVEPDQVVKIKVQIVPNAPVGAHVAGDLFIDDFTLDSFANIQALWPNADQLAALPYSYTVGP